MSSLLPITSPPNLSQREEVKMSHEASLLNIEKMSRLGALLQLPGTTSAFKTLLPRTDGSGVANRGRRAPSRCPASSWPSSAATGRTSTCWPRRSACSRTLGPRRARRGRCGRPSARGTACGGGAPPRAPPAGFLNIPLQAPAGLLSPQGSARASSSAESLVAASPAGAGGCAGA